MKSLYLASPLGFAESTEAYLKNLVSELRSSGYEVFDPWEQPEGDLIKQANQMPISPERISSLQKANRTVAGVNERGIRNHDFMVAVLDGVDVDSGTASEIGFAAGLGKRVYGLRTDFRITGDNDGTIVNLQVQHWIEASGGAICRTSAELLQVISATQSAAASSS